MTRSVIESSVFAIGGTEYAFGLDWIAASRSPSAVAHIKRQATQAQATHLAWRGKAHQVGLARLSVQKPPPRGWRAAAAIFADVPQPAAEPHALIAAFAFQSGEVWIVAASQGRLFADGDRLFPDVESAKAHFKDLYDRVPRWGSIFAPTDWGYPRANPSGPLGTLATTRASAKYPAFLIPAIQWLGISIESGAVLSRVAASGRENRSRSVITAGALGGLSIAIATFLWHGHEQTPLPAIQQVAPPWFPTVVSADGFLRDCTHQIFVAMMASITPGWDLGEVTCDRSGVSTQLAARNYTPLSVLATYHPDAVLQSASRSASLFVSWGTSAPARLQLAPPLPTPDDILTRFGALDEEFRARNLFTPPTAPSDPPPLDVGVPRPRPYRLMSWTLSTIAPPTLWRRALSMVGALDVQSVSVKPSDLGSQWTIKGIAYVAP